MAGKIRPLPAPHLSRIQRAELAAGKKARLTGKPVVVTAETTATTSVVAHPNGQLSMTSNALPVRVKIHGRWEPISTDLRRSAGGWVPSATAEPVTFSNGGTGPLVTITDPASGEHVSMSWPAPLPRPVVVGSVALYRSVLPRVNLRMEATDSGYRETLVVLDAAAAANPALRSISFMVTTSTGLSVRPGPAGSLNVFSDATGKLVFAAAQPQMWDSSLRLHLGPIASADHALANDAPTDHVTKVPVRYREAGGTGVTITMSPPAGALTGTAVRYPVYIDPNFGSGVGPSYYTELMQTADGQFSKAWNPSTNPVTSQQGGVVEVGFCGYENQPNPAQDCIFAGHVNYTVRDYFRFDTSTLESRNGVNATVQYVQFSIEETGNSDGCTERITDLYSTTGGISSSTSWGGPQGSKIAYAYSNAGGDKTNCPAGSVDFNNQNTGSGALLTTLQDVATDSSPNVTLELRADTETFLDQYKTYADNPTLEVWYNFPPSEPINLNVKGAVVCTGTTYTSDPTPTLLATATDNNPNPLQLTMHFTEETAAGASSHSGTDTQSSGVTQQWTTGTLSDGDYQFDAYAENNVSSSGDSGHTSNLDSPTAPWTSFTVLTKAPWQQAWIQSYDYPASQWGQPSGAPGTIRVGTNGASNIAGFAYSFDTEQNDTVPASNQCDYLKNGGLGTSVMATGGGNESGVLALIQGTQAQIQVPPSISPGQHTLYVTMFDNAHNPSAEASYTFYVAPNYVSGSQPVTYINASSLLGSASGPGANNLLVGSNFGGVSFRGGSYLVFLGQAVNDSFTLSITVPATGTWQLGADMVMTNFFAQQKIFLDQATSNLPLGGTTQVPWDGYAPISASLKYLDLGTAYLTKGTHTLTFTTVGLNPALQGQSTYPDGINYLTLSPTSRYEGEGFTPDTATCGQPGSSPGFAYDTPTAGSMSVQYWGTSVLWSDHSQLFFNNSTPNASFTVQMIAPTESDYAIGVNLATGSDYGELQFDLADPGTTPVNLDNTKQTPIDAYSSSVSAQYVFLGGIHLTAGAHCLKVTVTRTDSNSVNNHYNAGIDFLELVPVTGATDANFTAAMNNEGIASDGSSSFGNFDMINDATGGNLSLQALANAGVTVGTTSAQGNTFSLNGATFTMPKLRPSNGNTNGNTYDNVIPDGQTILLPGAGKATDVALLVAATCGAWPSGTSATLTYGDGSTSNPAIPSVPDWLSSKSNAAVMTLGYWDQGSSLANSTSQPSLYELILPAKATSTLASIALPVPPVSFLTNTGSCAGLEALHILAIGTRSVAAGPSGTAWTGSYAAPMDVAMTMPPTADLAGDTVRESVSLSVPGSGSVRVRLSNAYAAQAVTFDAATIAAQAAAGGAGTATGPAPLSFGSGNSPSVTIPAGGDVYSNPVALPTGGSGALTISLHLPSSPAIPSVPVHVTPNAVTYYASGDQTGSSSATPFASTIPGLLYVAGLDVSDTNASDGTIAVLGDQTAASAPAGTTTSWASDLPAALAANPPVGANPLPGAIANTATVGTAPDHWWRMNGTSPGLDTSTVAYDSGAAGPANLALKGDATWTTDNPGTGTTNGALSLGGTVLSYATTSGQVVNTAKSFTVSAWVKMALQNSPPTQIAVSQDGTQASGFYLGYNATQQRWGFYFASGDSANPTFTGAYNQGTIIENVWLLLTGVYNASSHTASLYINGHIVNSTSVTAWSSTGSLVVGSDLAAGARSDQFTGEISDVRTFGTALSASQVSELVNDPGLSTITAQNSITAFRNYIAAEPNLRDVIISVGANDLLQGQSAHNIESYLSSLIAAIQGQYVANQGLPAVQAILTTIPPLGLPSSDPREQARLDLNSWIMGGPGGQCTSGGAQLIALSALSVDVACAVQPSVSSNVVKPSLLTGGLPNASYYSTIANTIAATIAGSGSVNL